MESNKTSFNRVVKFLICILVCILYEVVDCFPGEERKVSETKDEINYPTSIREILPENLLLIFYNESYNNYVSIPASRIEKILDKDYYDPSKRILLFTGGQGTPHTAEKLTILIEKYLASNIYNVIFLDHYFYSSNPYIGTINARYIGETYGKAVTKLIDNYGVSSENIELHGHSMGTNVISALARNVEPKVRLLVGLDPARNGGYFERGHAKYTISMRSDAGYNGDIKWNSDTEFIANNGVRIQPGCPPSDAGSCSHIVSFEFWVNMITNPELFYAVKCNEIECDYSTIVQDLGPDFRKKGTFYFRTGPNSPYGLGLEGVKNIIPTKNSTLTYKPVWVYGYYFPSNYGYNAI